MSRHKRGGGCVAVVAVLAMLLPSAIGLARVSDAPATGAVRSIVLFNRAPGDITERLRAAGITHAAVFSRVRSAVVVGTEGARRTIAGWPEVVGVYPDQALSLQSYQATKNTGVDRVRTGAPPLHRAYTGKGVTVAVVDSGIDSTHPDLADAVALNLSFDLETILRPVGDTPVSPVETAIGVDELEHGTNIAGVIAGRGRAAVGHDDMRGVAPDSMIVNLRMHPLTEAAVLAAYEWLVAHHNDARFPGGIRVTANGWGSDRPIPAVRAALGAAIDQGMVVVFPAGNGGGDAEANTVLYPARYPEVIAVGAICKDEDDWSKELWNSASPTDIPRGRPLCGESRIVTYSSRGPELDVVAPGHDIWTVRPITSRIPGFTPRYAQPPSPGGDDPATVASNGTWYAWYDSTSMAHAHVAGIAALMLEANPDLTQADVERILSATARDIGVSGYDPEAGHGRVDALAAVAAAEAS
ncbi:MAG TPA: S8 family serine peptidase [Actinomycetota bacterium]|nr:S8 family serine peptidase [Actinomycetota bacterium]